MSLREKRYIIVKKEQETPVLLSFSEMELEYNYECKSGNNYT